MGDSAEGASSSSSSSDSATTTTLQLNVKTLDSRIYTFNVHKNMPVSVFKDKIANDTGLPVAQQRLIFRGKVLKDEHLLSDYHIENGHTLHLVARQATTSQPSVATSSGETHNTNNGNDGSAGGVHRNRVGQISHSVVLGTFNVGEQGEGGVPDLDRVIGAVLNSFGIGSQPATTATSNTQSSASSIGPGQVPQGDGQQGTHVNVAGQNQTGNQAHSRNSFFSQQFPPMPQAMQIPLAGAATIPSLLTPIPDSLSTLSEFMNRMELALSQTGNQSNLSPNATPLPTLEVPSNARGGLPTPEALSTVLQQAQRLLSDHAVTALSVCLGIYCITSRICLKATESMERKSWKLMFDDLYFHGVEFLK